MNKTLLCLLMIVSMCSCAGSSNTSFFGTWRVMHDDGHFQTDIHFSSNGSMRFTTRYREYADVYDTLKGKGTYTVLSADVENGEYMLDMTYDLDGLMVRRTANLKVSGKTMTMSENIDGYIASANYKLIN